LTLTETVLGSLEVAEEPVKIWEPEGLAGLLGELPGVENLRSALVTPLQLPEGLVGFLVIAGTEEVGTSLTDQEHLQRIAEQLTVAFSNARLLEELDRLSWGALTALARAIDAKSPWTMGHSERVAAVSVALGRALDLSESSILNLQRGGLLHDIGKIGVPSEILNGEDPLTETGRAAIRGHPEAGVRILEPIPALAEIIPMVYSHHESWDGSGYPQGLEGETIPKEARVLAVADRFDAMTSRRPYRPSLGWEEAAVWIRGEAGRTLDPTVTRVFLELLEAGKLPVSAPVVEEEQP
jgi:putative nucleotidyltransferase with HDIG domain